MTTEVLLPDGTTGVFGDDMSDAEIKETIRKQFPPSKLPKATSKPAASNSRMAGPFDNDQGNIMWQEYQKSTDPKDRAAIEKELARLGLTLPTSALPKATAAPASSTPTPDEPSIYDTRSLPKTRTAGTGRSIGMGIADLAAGAGKLGSTLLAPFDLGIDALRRQPFGATNRERRRAIDEFAAEQGGNNWTSVVNQAAPEMLATGKPFAGVEKAVVQGVQKAVPSVLAGISKVSPAAGRALPKALGVGADVGTNAAYAGAVAAAEGGNLDQILGAFRNAALLGGAVRGGIGGVSMGLEKATKGRVPDHLTRFLQDQGIPVTPGMMYPKTWISALENALRWVPGFGGHVEAAQERVGRAYVNRFANDALKDLVDVVPDQTYPSPRRPTPQAPGGPPGAAPQPQPAPQGALPPGAQAPTQSLPPFIHPVPPDFQPGQGGPLVVDPRGNAGVPAVGPTYEPLHQRRLNDPTVPLAERVPPEGLPPPGPGTGMVDMEPRYTPVWQKRLGDPTTPMVEEVPPGALPPPGQNPALGGPQGPGGRVPPRDWPESPTGPDQQVLPGPQPPPGAGPRPTSEEVPGSGGRSPYSGMPEPETLETTHKMVPRKVSVEGEGIELVKNVYKQIDAAYNDIVPHTYMRAADGVSALIQAYRDLPSFQFLTAQQQRMVRRFINERLLPEMQGMSGNARLDGRTIKNFDSLIGHKARSFLDDPQTRPMAEALFHVQHRLRAATQGTSPEHRHALQLTNEAFRKALPLHRATEQSLAGTGGVPSSVQLREAMKHYGLKPDELNDAMSQIAPQAPKSERMWRGVGGLGYGIADIVQGSHGLATGATLLGSYLTGKAAYSPAGVALQHKLLSSPDAIRKWLAAKGPYATQIAREVSE